MNLKSSERVDTNVTELVVELTQQEFEEAIEQAYRKNSKQITVPGFRKGKAPRKVIEKYYGENVFFEEAVNIVYPKAFEWALREANIEPIDEPQIEIEHVGHDGFSFKAKVLTKPEVTLEKYKGIEVEKRIFLVSEAEIDEEIEKVRNRSARLITIEDRAAQMGDTIVFDFEGFVDGVAFEGGKGEKHTLKIGSYQFLPEFEEQLVGKKAGEPFEINVTFPQDYHAPELSGKEAVFKCLIHEVKVVELPELDDEFAKDVSEFDTLAEYREDIRKKLQAQHDKAADDEMETELMKVILEGMKAEVPPIMYERQTEALIQDFAFHLSQKGISLDQYKQMTSSSEEEFKEQFVSEAVRQVRTRLALEQIVKLENIVPSVEDLDAEYKLLAENYNMDEKKLKKMLPPDQIIFDVAVGKAIKLVKDTAIVKEVVDTYDPTKTPEIIDNTKEEKKEPAKKSASKKASEKEIKEPKPKRAAVKKTTKNEGETERKPSAKKLSRASTEKDKKSDKE